MNKRKSFIILFTILFVITIILIKTNIINSFDEYIYNLVTIKQTDILTNIFKIITTFGSTAFIISLCAFWLVFFIILKKKNKGILITSCLIISTIMNNVIKIIIRRPRPEVLKLVIEKTFSFPSGHMMASVSMYGFLLYLLLKSNLNKKIKWSIGIFLSILPIIIGVSRIYLGVHFASDILGASFISIVLLLIEFSLIEKYNLLGR